MGDSTSVMPAAASSPGDLRERTRNDQSAVVDDSVSKSVQSVQETVRELNAREAQTGKEEKDKKTFGRTPDGTEDMVSQLFDPTKPKVAGDIIIVVALIYQIALMYLLPKNWRIPVFAFIFLFWRMCYNLGIGLMLHHQSNHKALVNWARKSKIFSKPQCDNRPDDNPYPFLFRFLKREMETMITKDYVFEEAPVEYNTWLVFRRVVDLILMSDFTAFCLFAIANTNLPERENFIITIARWVGGIILVLFNLWVKLDAHRVVKDFAWFWGDCFFLIDQELTFDGVFELAPHPMYSIGYVGFYGIALMAASYNVLFISIVAHAAQLTFLTFVENPHIDRTYNVPIPQKRPEQILPSPPTTAAAAHKRRKSSSAGHVNDYPPLASGAQPSPVHNLIGLQNLDLLRVTDIAVVLLQVYMYATALLTPSTALWKTVFVLNATIWRVWYSFGIGFILDLQANEKWWTRHFVKYGESTEEAWRQWKGMYHISMIMCYTSFICAAWKMYGLPADWQYGTALLRHVLGAGLIALQCWTSMSIYESLGEFGWFFGDFFFDPTKDTKLTYSGIYRYLNNPERTIGLAGVWGFALISWSKAIFLLALLSHILTLCFIQFVEKPHMQKLYNQGIRQTSGVSKNLRRSVPQNLQRWTGSVDKVIDEAVDSLEEFVEQSGPKLAKGFHTFVQDSSTLFKQFPARISITRLRPELAGYDSKDYSVKVDTGSKEEVAGSGAGRLSVAYGAPLRVQWTAPLNHSKKDWVGLYLVGDNPSRETTTARSQGRWVATNPEAWSDSLAGMGVLTTDKHVSGSVRQDGETTDFLAGELEFVGDKLFWLQGALELRYHHDGGHHVVAISQPFEITIPKFEEAATIHSPSRGVQPSGNDEDGEQSRPQLEQALLPLVRACFNPDDVAELAPRSVDEPFFPGPRDDSAALLPASPQAKFAKRLVYAVRAMFGIEFAPGVVTADGNVRNLAWRIWAARRVLRPYLSGADGDEEDELLAVKA